MFQVKHVNNMDMELNKIEDTSHQYEWLIQREKKYHTHAIHRQKATILSFQNLGRAKKSDERLGQGSHFSVGSQSQNRPNHMFNKVFKHGTYIFSRQLHCRHFVTYYRGSHKKIQSNSSKIEQVKVLLVKEVILPFLGRI